MPSVTAYRRRILELAKGGLGFAVPLSAVTATTATANMLKYGGVGNQIYSNAYILRPESASVSVDRARFVTDFAPATGVATHAGANWTDTTVGTETAEFLWTNPRNFDFAIQDALQSIRRDYRCIVPTRPGNRWYDLSGFDWIQHAGHVRGVKYVPSPVLTKNRNMDQWSEYTSASVLKPDFWTVNGASATVSRSTTGARRRRYTAALVRAGTDCYLEQVIGLMWDGVGADSLRGETVGALAVVHATVAARAYISITDGITETTSSAHTGGSTPEELTVSHTVSSTATTLAVRLHVKTGDTTAYFNEAYGFYGTINDALRRDDYDASAFILSVDDSWYDQSGAPNSMQMRLGDSGLGGGYGGQFVLHAPRPFAALPSARVMGDLADADESDAPLDLVATIGVANVYAAIEADDKETSDRRSYAAAATREWAAKAKVLRSSFPYENPEHGVGADLLTRRTGLAPTVGVGGWR
jgi:hypothetical protein